MSWVSNLDHTDMMTERAIVAQEMADRERQLSRLLVAEMGLAIEKLAAVKESRTVARRSVDAQIDILRAALADVTGDEPWRLAARALARSINEGEF